MELGRGLRLIDVGFGAGFPLLELAARFGDSCEVHGLDSWLAGHERTRFKLERAGERVTRPRVPSPPLSRSPTPPIRLGAERPP